MRKFVLKRFYLKW